MATLRFGGQALPLTFTNEFLAHLQAAVHQRFTKAGGFFLTGTYADDDGKEVTTSHWVDPSAHLTFTYDVRDESEELISPVELDRGEVEAIVEAMDRPVGVRATRDVWLTFGEKL